MYKSYNIRRSEQTADHKREVGDSSLSTISDAIPPAVQSCLRTFARLTEHVTEDGNEWAKNQEARLRAWASSLDVFARYESSIRYRLRLNDTLAAVILQIVEAVEACLLLLSKFRSGPMYSLASKSRKVEVLQRETREGIRRLIEMATFLHAAATQKEDDKALAYDPRDGVGNSLSSKHTIYVREQIGTHLRINRARYPFAREGVRGTATPNELQNVTVGSDFFTERLFGTIMQRWRLLCYRQRRAEVSAASTDKGYEVAVVENASNPVKSGLRVPASAQRAMDAVTNRLHEMPPRLFAAPTLSEGQRLPKSEVPMTPQAQSVDTGMPKTASTDLEFPTPPQVASSGEALCPFCTTLMPVENFKGNEWRTHVLRDLEPYICVFEKCSNALARFASATLWKQHISEEHFQERWFCQDCACYIDYSPVSAHLDVTAHIRDHDAAISDSEVQLIVRQTSSRQPARLLACAFCFGFGATESETPEKHWNRLAAHMIDEHMIPLSMLSLPLDSGADSDIYGLSNRLVGEADGSNQRAANPVSLNYPERMTESRFPLGVDLPWQELQSLDTNEELEASIVDGLGGLAKASPVSQPASTTDPLTALKTAVSIPLLAEPAVAGDLNRAPAAGKDVHFDPLESENIRAVRGSEWELNPWQVCNLLTLDGGGVRGYWSLLVLQRLMQLVAAREETFSDPENHNVTSPAYHSFEPLQYQLYSKVQVNDKECTIPPDLDRNDKNLSLRSYAAAKRFLPCHYFDYIGGTSTGGLIAIMLGRLRMTVADCIAEYKTMCSEVFGKPRKVHQLVLPLVNRPKYDARRLHRVVSDIVERRKDANLGRRMSATRLPSQTLCCQTFVTSYAAFTDSITKAYVLRSYLYAERDLSGGRTYPKPPLPRITRHEKAMLRKLRSRPQYQKRPRRIIKSGPAADILITDAVLAAMVAPSYFKPVKLKIDGKDNVLFEDGEFGSTSNPTMVGLEEVVQMHGRDRIGTIVSIGTAKGDKDKEHERKEKFQARTKRAIDLATDHDNEHRRAEAFMRDAYKHHEYFRLDSQRGRYQLPIALDEWLPKTKRRDHRTSRSTYILPGQLTMEKIDKIFEQWALDPDTHAEMQRCAEALVECRRARSQDMSKWERFATGSEFRCQLAQLHDACNEVFVYRDKFEDHLRTLHDFREEGIRREVDMARTRFTYQAQQGA